MVMKTFMFIVVFTVLSILSFLASGESGDSSGNNAGAYVTGKTTIGELIHHSAFDEFGRYLLPNEHNRYDEDLELEDAASVLKFTPGKIGLNTIIRPLNRMINDVSDGKTLFYEFYNQEDMQRDPSKQGTGLFFFRGDPGAPFVVHCPGGAFIWVCSLNEGFPHAVALNEHGYNTFVLKYRVGQGTVANNQRLGNEDLAAALTYIFENADQFQVSTRNYAVWGTSAGARLAAAIGSYGTAGFGGKDLPKPGMVMMAYTAYGDYSNSEPPTYVIVGEDDSIASPSTMQRRIHALKSMGVDTEFHVYPNIGHGFGLGTGTSADGWIEGAIRFWETHMSHSSTMD